MESPVTTHSYHLRSWSHRCSSSPTASTPTLPSSATWHIRLPWRLSWDNYSSSKELKMPQPFTPKLFNSSAFAWELHVSQPPWSLNSGSKSLTPLTLPSLLSPPETSPAQLRPSPNNATMSQPVVSLMPTCRDHGAPTFDPSKPWELCCFFEELKSHFRQSNVNDEALMKKHALWFAD